MTFLQRLLGMATTRANPLDDRYYQVSDGAATISGVYVDSETALKLSVVYACDRLLSETIASLPAIVYERLADGGRQRATNHPLYDILHTAPNAYQTPFEFFDFMTHCAVMRGSGYAKIVAGPRGFVDSLEPIHPDRVREQSLGNGKLRYKVRSLTGGQDETLNDEDMLHVRGMSRDGISTISVLTYARESLGGALGAERYAARFWRNGARPGGVLETDKPLNPEVIKRVSDSWAEAHSGENQHKVAVLEQGLKWQDVGMSNEDAQLLNTREFHAEDACRWFRVPPHMVGLTSKVTSWGSGIQQLGIGFVTYTLLPWLVRWQQAISRDLILAPQKYFVEFLADALMRGDLGERYNAYSIGRDKGWLSPNDVRRLENMNPIPPEAGGDSYGPSSAQAPFASQPPTLTTAYGHDHYARLVHESAARIVRKEVTALRKAAGRCASQGDWLEAVEAFYRDHARLVAQTMCIPAHMAERYVAAQIAEASVLGAGALDEWEARRVADLAAMVLEAQYADT